jgi:excisionase family DNA binding protein
MTSKYFEPAALTIVQAAKAAGISRSHLYQQLSSGRLAGKKIGKRTVIPMTALQEWMDGLPAYRSPSTTHAEKSAAKDNNAHIAHNDGEASYGC